MDADADESIAFQVSHFDARASAKVLDASDAAPTVKAAAAMRPLSVNFRAAQAAYTEVEGTELAGNDPALQRRVGEGLALCEAALLQATHQAVFSANELGEDINTNDLKYLLLPFFRGELLLRVVDQAKRVEALEESLACLRGFLSDLERLEMLHEECKGWETLGASASSDPARVRTQKLERHKASKIAKERLAFFAEKAAKQRTRGRGGGGDDNDDDEDGEEDVERETVLLNLRCCCHVAIDSIRAAEMELDMLKQIAKMRRPDGSLPPPPTLAEENKAAGLQMFSLVNDPRIGLPPAPPGVMESLHGGPGAFGRDLRSLVDGSTPSVLEGFRQTDPGRDRHSRLSYASAMRQIHTGEIPGLYTLTVEEGMRDEEAKRALAEAKHLDEMGEREEARNKVKEERELGNDEEDEEERQKQIKKDDWKDTHKRGAGNRKNRS